MKSYVLERMHKLISALRQAWIATVYNDNCSLWFHLRVWHLTFQCIAISVFVCSTNRFACEVTLFIQSFMHESRMSDELAFVILHSIPLFLPSAAQHNGVKEFSLFVSRIVYLASRFRRKSRQYNINAKGNSEGTRKIRIENRDGNGLISGCVWFVSHYCRDEGLCCCHCLSPRMRSTMKQSKMPVHIIAICKAMYVRIEAVQRAHFIIQHCWFKSKMTET